MKCYSVLFVLLMIVSLTTAQNNIGIQLYSFRNQFKTDVPGTLNAVEKMGFKLIEGGDSYGMPVKDIKMLLDKSKFKVISVQADYKDLEKDPMLAVEKAKAYGASYVMCAWDSTS